MNNIFLLLLILVAGAGLSYMAFKFSAAIGNLVVLVTGFGAASYFFWNIQSFESFEYSLGGFNAVWQLTAYSKIFAALVMVLSPMALLYSTAYMKGQERLGTFYFNFLLSIFGMIGILFSQDFISLFIFWEIMTWSSYLIVIYLGIDVEKVGVKYMVFSAAGAYAMFMAITLIYRETGSFMLDDLFAQFSTLESSSQITISLLLLFGFAVKSALMPMHVWAPGAYSNSPMAYTSIFSGALSKMGVFGVGIVFLKLLVQGDYTIINDIVAWAGGITAVLATFYAIIQDDAKKLLAYSSISQLGYIVMGFAIGTEMSVMAAMFLAILHGVFKGTLFMAIGAVERQVGTTDMTQVSGLIRKMPFTFTATLISIIALAGIPPLGGFVGKWLLYESMITSSHYVLVIMAFISSTAAFLYSFRILFSLFLGQEEKEFAYVKEAPLAMIIPMMLLIVVLLVTGTYPGLLFEPIANGMAYLGFENVQWEMSMLVNAWGDTVNLQQVSISVGVMFVLAGTFVTLHNRKRTNYASTKDISTSGEIPAENENLTYQMNFYKPFERAIAPLMKRKMDDIYMEIGNGLSDMFQFVRRIYSGNGQTYAIYVVLFLITLLAFSDQIFK